MDTLQQMLLPGVAVPLGLSLALAASARRFHWQGAWGLALIWLLSYFWIRGVSGLPPREAVDWLWLIGLTTLAAGIIPIASRGRWLLLSGLLAAYLSIIAWPALRYNASLLLFVEMAVVTAAGAMVLHRLTSGRDSSASAMPMAIVSGGYAVVAALGGSLVVGLLSGALASALGGFALYEFRPRTSGGALPARATLLATVWLLCLMFVGRVYADFPSGPLALLLAALVMGLLVSARRPWHAMLIAGLPTAAAIAWLVLTQDPSSYY